MKMSEQINEIASALSKVQGELKPAKFDAKNPFFKSKYTTLAGVWESVRELLYVNNLTVVQDCFTAQSGIGVETTIIHESGQYLTFGPLIISLGPNSGAHAIGSASTYAKRYALAACLGVCSAEEDDDGNHANSAAPKKEEFTPELTQKELDEWVETLPYDLQDIQNYLAARAKHFKHSLRATAYEMKADPEIFDKNIQNWLSKQEK